MMLDTLILLYDSAQDDRASGNPRQRHFPTNGATNE